MELNEMEKRMLYQTEGSERYAILHEMLMASRYAKAPDRRKAADILMEKLRPLSDGECMEIVHDIRKNYRLPKEGRTIGEMLAEARQKSGAGQLLALLHAKSDNVQNYVREAVEAEIYGRDKGYIEKISDLCRFHDSQNPEHIYDITNAVIQSAQYMAAVRMDTRPTPVSSLLPVLATASRLMVYGLCNTALSVAGQVLMGIEKAFEMKKERQIAVMEKGENRKEQKCGKAYQIPEWGSTSHGIPALRHQPHQNADTVKRQGNGSHKGTEKAGYEQLSLSFDGGYAFCDCGRAL